MMRKARDFPSFLVWDDFKTCDWCGRGTHGRTYYDDPAVIYCTSCHAPLEGTPNNSLDDDVKKYCAPS